MDDILNKIELDGIKRYGSKQDCCGIYESYCRCYTMEYKKESLKKMEGGIPLDKLKELKEEWKK